MKGSRRDIQGGGGEDGQQALERRMAAGKAAGGAYRDMHTINKIRHKAGSMLERMKLMQGSMVGMKDSMRAACSQAACVHILQSCVINRTWA